MCDPERRASLPIRNPYISVDYARARAIRTHATVSEHDIQLFDLITGNAQHQSFHLVNRNRIVKLRHQRQPSTTAHRIYELDH